jgi:hypothetical protein
MTYNMYDELLHIVHQLLRIFVVVQLFNFFLQFLA